MKPVDFNSYGARRGNDRVMTRGTFANIRIRNLLAPGTEGGVTRHLPDGQVMPIYDAAMKYKAEGVPLVVLAGAEYGTGSSRDWAAKGTYLLGRPRRAGRQLRADPPQQSRRHGHPAAGASAGQDVGVARSDGRRGLRDSRSQRSVKAALADYRPCRGSRRQREGVRLPRSASTRRWRWITIATAGFCRRC